MDSERKRPPSVPGGQPRQRRCQLSSPRRQRLSPGLSTYGSSRPWLCWPPSMVISDGTSRGCHMFWSYLSLCCTLPELHSVQPRVHPAPDLSRGSVTISCGLSSAAGWAVSREGSLQSSGRRGGLPPREARLTHVKMEPFFGVMRIKFTLMMISLQGAVPCLAGPCCSSEGGISVRGLMLGRKAPRPIHQRMLIESLRQQNLLCHNSQLQSRFHWLVSLSDAVRWSCTRGYTRRPLRPTNAVAPLSAPPAPRGFG